MAEHGTVSRANHGCSCAECRAARAAYDRERRERLLAEQALASIVHGRQQTWEYHACRCRECVLAHRRWLTNERAWERWDRDREAGIDRATPRHVASF